jgi:hypothetical protein
VSNARASWSGQDWSQSILRSFQEPSLRAGRDFRGSPPRADGCTSRESSQLLTPYSAWFPQRASVSEHLCLGWRAGSGERSERWEGAVGAGWLLCSDAPGPIVDGFR